MRDRRRPVEIARARTRISPAGNERRSVAFRENGRKVAAVRRSRPRDPHPKETAVAQGPERTCGHRQGGYTTGGGLLKKTENHQLITRTQPPSRHCKAVRKKTAKAHINGNQTLRMNQRPKKRAEGQCKIPSSVRKTNRRRALIVETWNQKRFRARRAKEKKKTLACAWGAGRF